MLPLKSIKNDGNERVYRPQQVRTYLKFVRAKRDIALQSMESEFRDVNNDRYAVMVDNANV